MARTTAATARRATGIVVAIAMAVCSCGGGAMGFVLPTALTPAPAKRGLASETAHGNSITAAAAKAATVTETAAAAAAAATRSARPRGDLFRLRSAKGPSPSGPDIMDSIGGLGRELTTEEKIAALQKEVQAQAAKVAEADQEVEEAEEARQEAGGAAIPSAQKDEEEISAAGFFSKDEEFDAEEGFVDEGKNIKWPNVRRAAQLTLLAVVAQIAFIVYIISLNSLLNTFPETFQHFVDTFIKSGDWSQAKLPDL